ncbi:hypothetical protein EDD22DRAFT_846347 [Suillus occidentalis]|nr:hypothetical protein EDD22DRAFT_846347 [Suillus occidentalis]
MDWLRNHEQASQEATQATPNNDHKMDVDGEIPWEFDGQGDGIQEGLRAHQEALGLDPWAPFADAEEWGLNAIDEFMKLPITSSLKTSFTSKYSLMKAIDKLPHDTEWQLKRISVEGNKLTQGQQYETKDLELWMRDPVECICELMANPEFGHMVSYVPERVFSDAEGKSRWYDEMWTDDWWWEMQGRLPQGAVVAPVILTSDKTSLSLFWGDQEVWPVYLSLGNISKNVQCQPSKHTTVLIAYLLISKLECFTQDTQSVEHYWLFHYCMSLVLKPLVRAGAEDVDVTCPDHQVQCLYPIVAVYIADFPEQCLIACCMENSWCSKIIGEDELNTRFKAMSSYARLWHFKKGAVDNKVLAAVHGVLDFIYYAQYQSHTEESLSCMQAALELFHADKNVFVEHGVWEHFNIPKIHSMSFLNAST